MPLAVGDLHVVGPVTLILLLILELILSLLPSFSQFCLLSAVTSMGLAGLSCDVTQVFIDGGD